MIKKAKMTAALALVALLLMGLAACCQNEFSEPGTAPPAPKDPPPAQRVERGVETAQAPPQPEPGQGHFTGSIALPAALAPKMKPGMVLFVIALDPGAAKPTPLAARRVADLHPGAFPFAFELGAEDSMVGQPLPAAAEIVVRLDSDGDLKTSVAGDLVAGPISAQAGKRAELTLQEPAP